MPFLPLVRTPLPASPLWGERRLGGGEEACRHAAQLHRRRKRSWAGLPLLPGICPTPCPLPTAVERGYMLPFLPVCQQALACVRVGGKGEELPFLPLVRYPGWRDL